MRGPFDDADFRRLFAGRLVTNVGDSFYFIAAMWLVYDLTGDPFYSGLAGFLTLAPTAFQFLAGPLVDRWSIRRVLSLTQTIQAVVVLAVPVAAYYDCLSVGLVLLVMPLLSSLNQLVYPAQSAALPRLLDEEDLVAANSAFSTAYQGIEMVANAAGGIVVALVGGAALFALDSVTFLVAASLFVTVTVPPATRDDADDGDSTSPKRPAADVSTDGGGETDMPDRPDPSDGYTDRLREGFAVMRGSFLTWLVAGAAVVNFATGMSLAAMPAYAESLRAAGLPAVLGDAGAYGILMGAFAAGNLLGAVGAGTVSDWPLGRLMIVGFMTGGLCWIAAVAVNWLPVTAALLALALVPVAAFNVQMAAAVQSAVPERLVGRVSSVLGSASAAAIPVGSLAGGWIAGRLTPQSAMWGTGVGLVLLTVYTLAVPALRALPVVERVELEGSA